MSIGSKRDRNCYTCRYWTGCSVKVNSPHTVDYNHSEMATCNLTGMQKYAWNHCKDHDKRLDF